EVVHLTAAGGRLAELHVRGAGQAKARVGVRLFDAGVVGEVQAQLDRGIGIAGHRERAAAELDGDELRRRRVRGRCRNGRKYGDVTDLAGGMRSLLGAIENEVRAVSALSEQIDVLVAELNARRDEQAARLLALDALQGSVTDAGLSSFLEKAIRPRRTRVPEL